MRAVAITVALLLLPGAARAAETTPIQPGDWADGCTLGWAFDGSDGAVYFGIVAHCVQLGQSVHIADPASLPAPAGPTPGETLGRVVARGANDDDVAQDIALIRVQGSLAPRVSGELRGHPGIPTGVIVPTAPAPQDALQLSGWGIGWEVSAQTRESRQAMFLRGDELSWEGVAPVTGGDSGGPVAHVGSGAAIGFVKGGACGDTAGGSCTWWGPSIAALQRLGAAQGLTLSLRVAGARAPVAPPPPSGPEQQPGAPGGSPAPPAPAEPAPAVVRLRPGRARARSRSLAVRVATDRRLRSVRVTLDRAGVRVAVAKLRGIAARTTVRLSPRSPLRRGRHRLALTATDDRGRAVRRVVGLTVR